VDPVAVGMSWSRDCRILDRDVSSEGNDASSGSCLGVGPWAGSRLICLIEGAGGGGVVWPIRGPGVGQVGG